MRLIIGGLIRRWGAYSRIYGIGGVGEALIPLKVYESARKLVIMQEIQHPIDHSVFFELLLS